MNKKIKIMGSVILSAVLAQSMLPLHVYALEDENPTQKTETVYAVLNADGSISDTIVSSWLHDDDGIHNIKETLDETDVDPKWMEMSILGTASITIFTIRVRQQSSFPLK